MSEELAKACVDVMLTGDACSRALGMRVVEAGERRSVVTMTVRADMVNGHNICHGGMIFSLADSAFAFACNSENLSAVAAGAQIDFLNPAKLGEELTATARAVHQAKRRGIYEVKVVNQDGATVALLKGQSHRIGTTLVPGS